MGVICISETTDSNDLLTYEDADSIEYLLLTSAFSIRLKPHLKCQPQILQQEIKPQSTSAKLQDHLWFNHNK